MDLDIDTGRTRRFHPFPNLALMKLSAYHKAKGNDTYLNFPLKEADIAYASCVFTWHRGRVSRVPETCHRGGSGLKLDVELSPDIEHIMPDYDLYPGVDFSMGFTSRGCPRRCPWCKVPQKEGDIRPAARIYDFWDRRHHKIKLLDNNLLAAPSWRETMNDLLREQLAVDFNQGLDIRLVTDEVAWYLARLRLAEKKLRFAFDDIGYEKDILEGYQLLTQAGVNSRRLSFYVLYGFKEDDHIIERMNLLASLNVDVYPMGYRDEEGKEPKRRSIFRDTVFWHGAYYNKLKFLRLVGRLRE